MDDIQSQMSAVLQNPDMMEKIMAMAQSLSQGQGPPQPEPEKQGFSMPDIDFATIQKISRFLGKSNVDTNQRTLLNALSPYLSHERISKLEKAMRAARLASAVTPLLSGSGLPFGR